MNDDIEVTQEERLQDLARAYMNVRESLGNSNDAQKATALAQLSIAMSLIEREGYAEGEFEESDEEDEEEEEEL
jgi:hypothetical protein